MRDGRYGVEYYCKVTMKAYKNEGVIRHRVTLLRFENGAVHKYLPDNYEGFSRITSVDLCVEIREPRQREQQPQLSRPDSGHKQEDTSCH